MVVDDLNVVRVAPLPDKADAKLIVDADAVLPRARPLECFEAISRDCRKIAETDSDVQFPKLPLRGPFEGLKVRNTLPVRKSLCILIAKALDHLRSV